MKRRSLPITVKACLAGLLAISAASIAHAKAGDPAWAQCVWRTAPQSAENWLRMGAPGWADAMATPAELLGHRLIAICSTDAANERKPNRNPGWASLKAALKRARPAAPGPTDSIAIGTLLCRNHATVDGNEILYRIDVVRTDGAARTIIFQQHFTQHQGSPVRLPQDLRTIPPADVATSVACRAITSNGGLADA